MPVKRLAGHWLSRRGSREARRVSLGARWRTFDASAGQADGGSADLRRRRRRRALARGAGVVAVLVLIAGGLAFAGANRVRQAEPAEPELKVTNGALLGLPAASDATLVLLSGSLPTDVPLERLLPSDEFSLIVGFSPDGTGLRYYERERGRIGEIDLESGRRRTLWTCPDDPIICNGWAVPSPDGHHVAHTAGLRQSASRGHRPQNRRPDRPAWHVCGATGVVSRQFPAGTGHAGGPQCHRGGPRVCPPVCLCHSHSRIGCPCRRAWSPDGTRLAYAEPRRVRRTARHDQFPVGRRGRCDGPHTSDPRPWLVRLQEPVAAPGVVEPGRAARSPPPPSPAAA